VSFQRLPRRPPRLRPPFDLGDYAGARARARIIPYTVYADDAYWIPRDAPRSSEEARRDPETMSRNGTVVAIVSDRSSLELRFLLVN